MCKVRDGSARRGSDREAGRHHLPNLSDLRSDGDVQERDFPNDRFVERICYWSLLRLNKHFI